VFVFVGVWVCVWGEGGGLERGGSISAVVEDFSTRRPSSMYWTPSAFGVTRSSTRSRLLGSQAAA
jgi:hypothetical protein